MSNQSSQFADINGRQHPRTGLRVRINLTHKCVGDVSVYTDNMSDGGVFILSEGKYLPDMGEIVRIQVQDLPVDAAPQLRARVVRVDQAGIGVEFLER